MIEATLVIGLSKGSLLPKVWQHKRNGLFLGNSWFHNYVPKVFLALTYWTNYFTKFARHFRIYVRTHFHAFWKQTKMKNGTLIGLNQFIIVQIATVWKGLVLLFIWNGWWAEFSVANYIKPIDKFPILQKVILSKLWPLQLSF